MMRQERTECPHRTTPTWDAECRTWRCPLCAMAFRVSARGEVVEEGFL